MSKGSEDASDQKKIESELRGKALQIYWHMLSRREPLGVREIQKDLGFSSPSVVHHHLDKLKSLKVVDQDNYGRYFPAKKIEVGILQSFTRVGSRMLPRFIFYALFFTTLLALYVSQNLFSLNLFAVGFALVAALMSWYETLRVWRRKPF